MLDGVLKNETDTERVAPWPLKDEGLLHWFYSYGQACFERSVFGAALERADNFAVEYFWPREAVYDSRTGLHVIGWERCLSARPTCEVREPAGYTPELEIIERCADVTRILKRVDRACRLSTQVLELIFGDCGAYWATSPVGRIGAIYHLTAKGRAMVTADAAKSPIDLVPTKRMHNLVGQHKLKATPERSAAFAVVARQAQALERTARKHWLAARAAQTAA
jgi:hypothetical protein